MRDENIRTVEEYLRALKEHDVAGAPISDDIRFENPISKAGKGAEDFKAFLSGFVLAIHDITIIRHICEGEFVVTNWEVDSAFGRIKVLEIFRVRERKIIETAAYFDPRPVLGS